MTEQNKILEKKRPVFFQIGMITALSFVLFAFEWTSTNYEVKYLAAMDNSDLIDEVIQPYIEKKNKPKPQPKKRTITNQFKLVDEILEDEKVDPDIKTKAEPVVDPTPIIEPIDLGEDFIDEEEDPIPIALVEIQPYYDACLNPLDREDQSLCSYAKIREHIQENLKIPFIVKEIGVSRKTWVSFVVDEKGNATDVKILKGIHKMMDKEAIRIIKSLPRLNPASQQGKKVKVQYQIPINVVFN